MNHHHIKVSSVLSNRYSSGKWQKSKQYKRGSQQKKTNWKDNINSLGAASQRRIWELTGRRKRAARALWHFFQGQEHQLCQLQNGQRAHPDPLVNFTPEPAVQHVTRGVTLLPAPMCFPPLFSFSLTYTYSCVLYRWPATGEAVRCTNSSTLSANHCKKSSCLCETQCNSIITIEMEQTTKQSLPLVGQNSLL